MKKVQAVPHVQNVLTRLLNHVLHVLLRQPVPHLLKVQRAPLVLNVLQKLQLLALIVKKVQACLVNLRIIAPPHLVQTKEHVTTDQPPSYVFVLIRIAGKFVKTVRILVFSLV